MQLKMTMVISSFVYKTQVNSMYMKEKKNYLTIKEDNSPLKIMKRRLKLTG